MTTRLAIGLLLVLLNCSLCGGAAIQRLGALPFRSHRSSLNDRDDSSADKGNLSSAATETVVSDAILSFRAGAIPGTYDTTCNDSIILVVGSVNVDLTIPLNSFPTAGETVLTHDKEPGCRTAAGGKGANQAVACRRLSGCKAVKFVAPIGSDLHATFLREVLLENRLDINDCEQVEADSGLGLIFLQAAGTVSSVVVAGANSCWEESESLLQQKFERIFQQQSIACVLLQMEVPDRVNRIAAAVAHKYGVPVCQDIGGEARDISESHLLNCAVVSPNLSELQRMTQLPVQSEQQILHAARTLQLRGARNVLVTLGDCGSILLTESGEVLRQPCFPVTAVVDETGAGDNFRAAFAIAHFVERKPLQESLQFAAAAGAVSVTKLGAIPSCATRDECDTLIESSAAASASTAATGSGTDAIAMNAHQQLRGGFTADTSSFTSNEQYSDDSSECGYKFASRLNSMKDRQDLWDGGRCDDVWSWIARQGTVKGLDLIDFNYPQHITTPVSCSTSSGGGDSSYSSDSSDSNSSGSGRELVQRLQQALAAAGLGCGAICLRFPKHMQLGAYTNPDPAVRAEAIRLTKEACEWALALGANEVVVWSAFDGYDYNLQANYDTLWQQVVEAFQEVCDAFPAVKVSLEYKPTDENTRFFAVPSTGAAVLLMQEVDRENFGLTLDFGHCLMAGENPAQCVAMVQRASNGQQKLFGVQLGDGYGRLGAEDGLAFGSVHRTAALEFMLWLVKTGFRGHLYFDTFPRNEDPVRECEYNIRRCKRMLRVARELLGQHGQRLHQLLAAHDAMSVLELLEQYSAF